jgi:hypothetical protein
MYELRMTSRGNKVLVYVKRERRFNERGMWVEICHENDKEARFYTDFNRRNGLQVEKDERGFYRALVLKD